jgi:hypothetical protein
MSNNMDVDDSPEMEEEEAIDEFVVAFESVDEDNKDPTV